MNEIGGYFGLEQFNGREYHNGLIRLNTARNALLYVIKAKGITRISVPYFCCSVVKDICMKNGVDVREYHIGEDFLPEVDLELRPEEFLYVVNFYGQVSNTQITRMKEKYDRIIVDNVQAFFQKPMKGVDTIYSCRKNFGVPDGSYLSTDQLLGEVLDEDRSSGRFKHLFGRIEQSAEEYYETFQLNEASFDGEPIKAMSRLTRNLMRAINYEYVAGRRRDNYFYLEEALSSSKTLTLNMPEAPFAYPFYIKNGIAVRKALAKKRIYVPTLWPNVLKDMPEISREYDLAANILVLPCDQRYSRLEMERIVEELMLCINSES